MGLTATGESTYHLLGGHAYSLDSELAAAHVKKVLEVWPEEINDEDIVEALLTKIVHSRYASCQSNNELHIRDITRRA